MSPEIGLAIWTLLIFMMWVGCTYLALAHLQQTLPSNWWTEG